METNQTVTVQADLSFCEHSHTYMILLVYLCPGSVIICLALD